MSKMSHEQKAQRALKKARTRALAAEEQHERMEAKRREWDVNGTRLSREEFDAGELCRGCGQPIVDGRGDWPPLLKLTPEERAEYDATEAHFKVRHESCRASRWSVSGSRATHCSYCCPSPPLSERQIGQLRVLLSQRMDPQDLATWQLTLTCDHVIEGSQHRTHDRWSGLSVVECAACGRHRGVVNAEPLADESGRGSADR
jgi:hypothetical protein